MRPIPLSLRAGGCTFAEDPAQSCASVVPLWTAAADPRVLTVRAAPWASGDGGAAQPFDLGHFSARIVADRLCERVRIDGDGATVRLDVVEGRLCPGPVSLVFELVHGRDLVAQLDALRTFRRLLAGAIPAPPITEPMRDRLLALHAYDTRLAGVGLRGIAEALLGPGDWPGDGEHRKSKARRLVGKGAAMVRAGPRAILV